MSDDPQPAPPPSPPAQRPGPQTTEFYLSVAQLAFAAFALWIGKDDVAMVALAAAGLYPLSRAAVKR